MRSFNVLVSIILLFIGIIPGCGAGEDKPKGAEDISYWTPAWYDNEHIIYTKMVEKAEFHYGLLAEISNMSSQLVQRDNFICVTDLEGKEERILKQFRVKEPGPLEDMRKYFVVEGDKEIPIDLIGELVPADYDCSNEWVVFKLCSGLNTDACGTIYIMKPDGSQMRRLVDEPGCNPRISPDNKKVLYHIAFPYGKGTLCIVNTDGTENKKLFEDAISGVWSPDGEKIAYFCQSAEKEYFEARHSSKRNKEELEKMKKEVWMYNLKTGEKKELKRGSHPRDWGLSIEPEAGISTGAGGFSMKPKGQNPIVKYVAPDYSGVIPESIEVINFGLGYARISPDGKRIAGSPGITRDRRPGRPGRHYTGIGWKEAGSDELNFIKIDRVMTIK